jgi:exodeoxyribonuclease VII large subunit
MIQDSTIFSLIKKEELIVHEVKRIITKEHHQVEMLEQKALVMDPQKILDRGYSITLFEGKAVQNASLLKVGDQIVTRLKEGEVTSIVCPSS